MGTGNSVATGMNKAGQLKKEKNPDCETLKDRNDERRQDLKDTGTTDQDVVGPDGKGKGTTVSSCRVKTGGSPRTVSAHNNQKAQEKCPSGFASGGDDKVRSGKKKTLCGNYTHPDPAEQKSGHAEARILDTIGSGPPTALLFNIDWRPNTGPRSKAPCPTCHDMMCAAEKCGFVISICNKKNESFRVPCPVTPANRKALKKALGER